MSGGREGKIPALPEPFKLLDRPRPDNDHFYRDCYDMLEKGTSFAIPGYGMRNMESLGGKYFWGTFTIGLAGIPDAPEAADLVTGCVLTMNAGASLHMSLSSLQHVVDEIVVVDSGSTDGSLEIARGYTGRTIHKDWPGRYSAARNSCLAEVNTEWALQLDSDEFFASALKEALPRIIGWCNENGVDIVWFARRWVSSIDGLEEDVLSFQAVRGHWLYWPDPQARLMRMSCRPTYQGKVHDRLKAPGNRLAALITDDATTMYHLKFVLQSYEERLETAKKRQIVDSSPVNMFQLLPEKVKEAEYESKSLKIAPKTGQGFADFLLKRG